MPNNVCINSLSDENFSEEECEDLRQNGKVGLLKKPTLVELEEKARNLHKDIIAHTLAREKRALESKIGYANEKGRRLMLFQLLEERKLLETPSHLLQLFNTPPKVIPEPQEPNNQLKGPMEGSKQNEEYASPSEGKSSSLGKENQQNLIPTTSIGNVDLNEVLDLLIKPDMSYSSADSGSSQEVKDKKESLILSLKQVPISDFKSMTSVANGAFTCLHGLSINYSSLYECVRNYIRCCYLLASTEQFKQASSVEALALQYDVDKEHHEMINIRMKKLSTDIIEAITAMEVEVSGAEKFLVKFENEHLVRGMEMEHYSSSFRKVLEKLKRLQDDVRNDLGPCAKSKKQCYFEEIWEAFVNARTALG